MSKKLLLTGGSGFIGKYLLNLLSTTKDEFEVISVTRNCSDNGYTHTNNCVRQVSLDITKAINLDEEVHTVVHLAAEKNDENKIWVTNYEGTKNLLKWAIQNSVAKFVYLSSVAVYGTNGTVCEVTEDSSQCPVTEYGKSKSAAEELTRELCKKAGVNCIILRPAIVIGIKPREGFPLLNLFRSIKKGYFFYIGDDSGWFNYLSVKDVADSINVLINEENGNTSFILNTPVKLKEAVNVVAEACHVNSPIKRMPLWLGLSLGSLGTGCGKLLSRELPFNRQRLMELRNPTRFNGNLITMITNFRYHEGILKTLKGLVKYYEARGLL